MEKKNPPLKKLRKLRISSGFTIKDIAKMLDISTSMYAYIETGEKRLSYDIAVRISDIFDTSPDEIFYEDFDEFYKEELI